MAEPSTPLAKLCGKVLPPPCSVSSNHFTLPRNGQSKSSRFPPRSALPLRPACPSRLFLHIRHLLADCRTVVCFFIISRFHYSHRDCLPIELQDFVCALLPRHPRLKTTPRISPLHNYNTLQHLGVATYLRPPFSAFRLRAPQRGLWRLHTAVGAEAALSPYPSAARIGNEALQVIITNQHPTS